MKITVLYAVLLFLVSSCFKDTPSKEYAKVAGSWEIEKVIIDTYDSLGNELSQKTFKDRGYILLDFNGKDLTINGFAYSFNLDDLEFNSSAIKATLVTCDQWDVSVDAKHINFGVGDPSTGYSVMLIAMTISKLNSNKMHWQKIDRNANGSLARKEVFELKRSN